QICDCKKKIPKLAFGLVEVLPCQRLIELFELLPDLGARSGGIDPIVSAACRLLSNPERSQQSRERSRYTFEGARPLLLVTLQPLPSSKRFGCIFRRGIGEHVRMAPHQLFANTLDHVVEPEPALRSRELRLKHDLQEQIPELLS